MELYFNMSYEILGQTRTVDLVTGGSSIPVTDANKADYINKVFLHEFANVQSNIFASSSMNVRLRAAKHLVLTILQLF